MKLTLGKPAPYRTESLRQSEKDIGKAVLKRFRDASTDRDEIKP